jgi:hypothetical protein
MPNPDSKLAATIETLLGRLRQSDIDALPPARRHRLGALLRQWGDRCELRPSAPASALPADYGRGRAPTIKQVEVESYPDD